MTTIWGLLAKSLVDNEKIEEAIARLIQAHDDDETAHLEAGQSLQSHKISEIIDHAARSVLRDKLKFDRFTIDEHFNTLDGWGKTAGVYLDFISQVSLNTTAVLNNSQYLNASASEVDEGQARQEQDPNFDTRVLFYQTTNQNAWWGQLDPDVPAGWGFKVINATLYAIYWDAESVEHTEVITGINLTAYHRYRCEMVDGVTLKWYVDDVLKKTIVPDFNLGSDVYMLYKLKTTAASIKRMYVQNLHFDAEFK